MGFYEKMDKFMMPEVDESGDNVFLEVDEMGDGLVLLHVTRHVAMRRSDRLAERHVTLGCDPSYSYPSPSSCSQFSPSLCHAMPLFFICCFHLCIFQY